MANRVRHGKRYYKQMALEVAVRNPERYEGILKTFAKFEGIVLNDQGILDVYSQLYIDEVVTTDKLAEVTLIDTFIRKWIKDNCTHNNEWGYPTGYQAAFTRYLKTLSEFGFIYAQYEQKLLLSPIAKALVSGRITLSEAFAVQSMRFWRKSPYRRVLNDFNFFVFIIDSLVELKNKGHKLSINQFNVALFSDDGNVESFLELIAENRVGDDSDKAYSLVKRKYNEIDSTHAKVAKKESAFRDYGNTVFRVLQLTGFITIDYRGVLLLSPNDDRMNFYTALKALDFRITETAKDNELEYFKLLGSYEAKLEEIIIAHREKENYSTEGYNIKIPNIIQAYRLTKESIKEALLKVALGNKKGKDPFWFIQDPIKFEFLLTLFAYANLGDTYMYKPNFICDESGIPYSHAPGNIGDIEIFNKETYWLIEATLIRSKTQQINNETVNLFRHVDESHTGNKFLTLVAPYIHTDTKLIFDVASIITILKNNKITLFSDAQNVNEFVEEMKDITYFKLLHKRTHDLIISFRNKLNHVSNE